MIKLYGFGSGFGLPDPSPFVLKVDAYMRLAGIEFETVAGIKNLRKAPKGKLPFIKDNGKLIADSSFIIQYLEEKYDITVDQWLSDEQKSIAHLAKKSLDENLYWCLVYSRWGSNESWPTIKKHFFGSMIFPLGLIVSRRLRRQVKNQLITQGIGRYSDDEIKQIHKQSFDSLSVLLGDKPYFFGDKPCSLDTTAFAFLAEYILVTIDNSFNEIARSYPNLVAHCERMQALLYDTVTSENAESAPENPQVSY